jgi:CBS domain-containing protein
MIKITDYMSRPVITVKPTDTIRAAVKKMDQYNIGCLVVTSGKKPVGIMTERDVLRKVVVKNTDLDKTPVSKIMTPKVQTVTLQASLIEIASVMKSHSLRRIVVVNKSGEVAGIVTSRDLIDILTT